MHHELAHGDLRFERISSVELRPVVGNAIIVPQEPAIDEQDHAKRLHELRGRRDELNRRLVVGHGVAGSHHARPAGQSYDRLAAAVNGHRRPRIPLLVEEAAEHGCDFLVSRGDGTAHDVVNQRRYRRHA